MNLIKSELLSEIDFVDHGFFDRLDTDEFGGRSFLNVGFGRSDNDDLVLRNRVKIAQHFDVPVSNLIILNQVHGDVVHVIDSSNKGKYLFSDSNRISANDGDAIITSEPGLLIAVNTADCAPVLLCDKRSKYVAVIHAGWRGSNGHIIENTINKMKSLGCSDIVAAIGPCLQKRFFSIKPDVAAQVDRKYISIVNGRMLFDMQLQVLEKLLLNGVKSVSKMNVDTFSNDNYFSYRREGEVTGVQFSGIVIKE